MWVSHMSKRPVVLCKSLGRRDCAASTDRLGGAVRSATELIRGMHGAEDCRDLFCSFSCLYVKVLVLRMASAREKSGGFDAVAVLGKFRKPIQKHS